MAQTVKSRISAVLPQFLSIELKKISEEEHISQSLVLENALIFWLEHRLNEDTKKLGRLTFDDLPNENEWLSVQATSL